MNKDFEHIKRLIILIVFIIIVFAAVRIFFIPKSFGEYGHYKSSSLDENMDRPQNYAEEKSCSMCHEEKFLNVLKSRHKTVNCQTCHGPLLKHTEDPASQEPDLPKERNFCLICHEKNLSKPETFPQIDPVLHNRGLKCVSCHNPHKPELK